MDAYKNLALARIATAPSPPMSGTSLTVTTDHGARLPPPPFNATVWDGLSLPTPANAEIVRVLTLVGDVVTIARAQEGTAARAIQVDDSLAATLTKKFVTDVTNSANQNAGTLPDARLSANVQMKPIALSDLPPTVATKPIPVGDLPASVQLKPIAIGDLPASVALKPVAQADVTNLVSDLALKAPLASPALTGVPTAPTAAPATATTQLATTAFVTGAIALVPAGPPGPQGDPGPAGGILNDQWVWIAAATSGGIAAGRVALNHDTPALATQVLIHRLAGTSAGVDWSVVIASLQAGDKLYIQKKGDGTIFARYTVTVGPSAPLVNTFFIPVVWTSGNGEPANGVDVVVAFQRMTDFPDHHTTHETGGSDALAMLSASILTSGTLPDARLSANVQLKPVAESDVTNLVTDLAAKAPLASPALTGVPTAPTASGGTSTTQLATTAFVTTAVAAGGGGGGTPAAHHTSHEPGGSDALVHAAWTNLANTFTVGPTTCESTIHIHEAAGIPDSRIYRFLTYVDGSLYVQRVNDAVTAGYNLLRLYDGNMIVYGNTLLASTRPELQLQTTGATTKARLEVLADNNLNVTSNLRFDGAAWFLDDVAKPATMINLNQVGAITFFSVPAGSNPVTLPDSALQIQANGDTRMTGNSLITKTIPDLQLQVSGEASKAHLFSVTPNNTYWTQNISYDGANFQRDNTAIESTLVTLAGGGVGIYRAAPGANPASFSNIFSLDKLGNVSFPGSLVGGTIPDARLSANVALRTVPNVFTSTNYFMLGVRYQDNSAPVNQRLWNEFAYSDGRLYFQTVSDGGVTTGTPLYLTNDGDAFVARDVHCAGYLQSQGYVYPGRVDVPGASQGSWYLASHPTYGLWSSAGMYINGNVRTPGHILSDGYLFPGRADTGAGQSSWWLGAHGSYGLYTNTGLYAANLWAAGNANVAVALSVGQHIYERGRGTGLGEPIAFTPSLSATGASITITTLETAQFCVIGSTLILTLYLYVTLSATTTSISLLVPGGYTPAATTLMPIYVGPAAGGGGNNGYLQSNATSPIMYIGHVAGAFVTGSQWLIGTLIFPIT